MTFKILLRILYDREYSILGFAIVYSAHWADLIYPHLMHSANSLFIIIVTKDAMEVM
jgi:hypothetical protein